MAQRSGNGLAICPADEGRPTAILRALPRLGHTIDHRVHIMVALPARGHGAVDGLPSWVRWIIIAAVGLSPILMYFIACILGRFLRRKLWPRRKDDALVIGDQSGSTRKDEAVEPPP